MGWFDDKIAELKENAKREFDNGVKSASELVRARANEPAPLPAAAPIQYIQAASPMAKYAMIGALGVGAFFLFKTLGSKKRGR